MNKITEAAYKQTFNSTHERIVRHWKNHLTRLLKNIIKRYVRQTLTRFYEHQTNLSKTLVGIKTINDFYQQLKRIVAKINEQKLDSYYSDLPRTFIYNKTRTSGNRNGWFSYNSNIVYKPEGSNSNTLIFVCFILQQY